MSNANVSVSCPMFNNFIVEILPIEFAARVDKTEKNISATATMIVDRSKFDVRYGSGSFFEGLGDKLIYDDFEMKVNLTAVK